MEGVQSTKVDVKEGLALVEFDAGKTSLAKLEAIIAKVGNEAGSTKAENPHKYDEVEKKAGKSCCAGQKSSAKCCNQKK